MVEKSEEILVYPNPFADRLEIVVANNNFIKKIQVFSVSGKLLVQTEKNLSTLWAELPQGVYILRIETDKKIVEKRIVKKRLSY